MKGYSFQELVKLAEAAVKRAGDTMTGNLTALKVLVSGAQGTEANALTRKDYVDAELAKKLNLTGGTLTGNLTAPAVLVSSAQNTSVNALTRKDYVDSAIAAGDALRVSKTGDTMTGNLIVPAVLMSAVQQARGDSATRKDYVDSQVATRAPTTHTHTVAAITDLRPQDSTATANTLALRDAAADVHARLLRTTYQNDTWMEGAIAFRINNSNDNHTRYCSNPVAVRDWMRSAKTNWDMSWRAYIEDPAYPMTEYHIPGKQAVITYLTVDGAYRISSSNGAGGEAFLRVRFDPNGDLHANGAIYEMSRRVYSPNNQPHYSHNHTAAQGNADIVASGYGQVGTYMFAQVSTGGAPQTHDLTVGGTIAGSSLRPCSVDVDSDDLSHVALPGTWKCLGRSRFGNGETNMEAAKTLWIRIS